MFVSLWVFLMICTLVRRILYGTFDKENKEEATISCQCSGKTVIVMALCIF